MNNLDIGADPSSTMLSNGNIPVSMITSPSVSTFMPEEEASTCLLLPATPSPPPLDFIHPLTPNNVRNEEMNNELAGDDARAETSSSGSSGIGMDVPIAGTTTLYNNKNVYQNLENNGETIQQNGGKQYANLNIQITKDTPGFVHWNWPLIRKCTFFVFMAGIFAMAGIVIAMIVSLPKSCNPKTTWYKGTVFYEIFPASFQDYNNDGLGDLLGLTTRLGYLKTLGVTAVRLNSIFPSKNYPDHFENVTSLMEIDEILGTPKELQLVTESMHARNMSLILDLPIFPLIKELSSIDEPGNDTGGIITEDFLGRNINPITKAISFWLSYGVDGFYIKGLEKYAQDENLIENLREWKDILGENRILIINHQLLLNLIDNDDKKITEILKYVDLIDVKLDITQGTQHLRQQIQIMTEGTLKPTINGPQIHWSLGSVTERRIATGLTPNATLAATLLELMLPGTPNIFYGDEMSQQESYDPLGEHTDTKHLHHLSAMSWNTIPKFTSAKSLPWMPSGASASFHHIQYISDMIGLREVSPSIYESGVKKSGQKYDSNLSVKHSRNDILILERWFPRRNTFISITNLSDKRLALDLSAMFYGGEIMVGNLRGSRILFSEFQIGPVETIIIRLDK